MPEHQIKLTGWQAVAGVVVLIAILSVRLMTFNDKLDDDALMEKVEVALMTEYYPNYVENLRSAYENGDADDISATVDSIAGGEFDIESVKTSFPLFSFATSKEVIVKVTYFLDDSSGNKEKATNYYLFRHNSIANTWRHLYDSNAFKYYLNFM